MSAAFDLQSRIEIFGRFVGQCQPAREIVDSGHVLNRIHILDPAPVIAIASDGQACAEGLGDRTAHRALESVLTKLPIQRARHGVE